MQQAVPAAFGAEVKSGPAHAASRANKVRVASAAMLCAGAMAVSPVSPVSPLSSIEIQQRAVQLTAAANPVLENPLLVWENIFTNTSAQVGTLISDIAARPFPILSQVVENQQAFLKVIVGAKAAEGQRRGTGIVGSVEGLEKTINNLPVRLQAAAEFLAAGQFTEAFVEINT